MCDTEKWCECSLCITSGDPVPYGTCHCHCGAVTEIAKRTRYERFGVIKGQPVPYVRWHHAASGPPGFDAIDCGHETPCHVFRRSKSNGYGMVSFGGVYMQAHRAAWIEAHGPIPAGHKVHHRCHTKACVRLDHLELKRSQSEHMREHGRKLTLEKAREIRASDEPQKVVLAGRYGVAQSLVSAVKCNAIWRED